MVKFMIAFLCLLNICAEASVKDDLAGLYASALNNNWKKVTANTEAIISSYEKNNDIIKVQKQLNELEKFILMNNLNPQKTQIFLSELNSVRQNLKERVTTSPTPKQVMVEVVEEPVKPAVVVFESKLSLRIAALIIFMLAISSAAAVLLIRRQRQIRNEHFYPFEKKLSPKDLQVWKKVKPAFRLSPDLIKGPVIFSSEKLFSLEFELSDQLNKDGLTELRKVMSEISAELLLLSEWSASNESSKKLVLNFPKEGLA